MAARDFHRPEFIGNPKRGASDLAEEGAATKRRDKTAGRGTSSRGYNDMNYALQAAVANLSRKMTKVARALLRQEAILSTEFRDAFHSWWVANLEGLIFPSAVETEMRTWKLLKPLQLQLQLSTVLRTQDAGLGVDGEDEEYCKFKRALAASSKLLTLLLAETAWLCRAAHLAGAAPTIDFDENKVLEMLLKKTKVQDVAEDFFPL
jgi:hypothetical protein